MHNRSVAIMATGGIDSTVLMYQAVEAGEKPTVVSVDYGHVAFAKQMELLERHTQKLGLAPPQPIRVLFHPWQSTQGLFVPGFRPTENDPLADWDKLRYENFFIEGRNLIMVAYALAWCSAHRIDELRTGYLYAPSEWEHRRSYKLITGDNSPHFVDMVNLLTLTGFSHQVRLRAPFYESRWEKGDTVREGRRLGINLERDTYSCYFVPPCNVCDNCLLRIAALKEHPPAPSLVKG